MYKSMVEKYELTRSELAERIGVRPSEVTSCISLVNRIPKKFAGKIANNHEAKGKVKKGKISSSIAKRILGNETKFSLNDSQREKMFDWGRQDGVSSKSIDNAFRMMASGSNVSNAIKKASKIKIVSIDVPVTTAAFDKLLKEYGGVSDVKGALIDTLYNEGDLVVSRP